jgi:uncharacterized membrane protein
MPEYLWLKWVHVLGMVIYAGGFLTLTRMLGHAVRFEDAQSRTDAYRILKRMHLFVDWGGLLLMLAAGLWLAIADPATKAYFTKGYFHMKLTFVLVLVVTDVVLSRKLFGLRGEGEQPGPNFFRIVHGLAGLAVMGALLAVFVVRG